jgi:hypothetical protein
MLTSSSMADDLRLLIERVSELADRCFAHIPTQVQLEIRGYKDIYGY